VRMWGLSLPEFHCLRYFLKYKFIYHRLKRSGKSVNPLNPGSNRRCGCADVPMCGCADLWWWMKIRLLLQLHFLHKQKPT
jgi:hypothetical protein